MRPPGGKPGSKPGSKRSVESGRGTTSSRLRVSGGADDVELAAVLASLAALARPTASSEADGWRAVRLAALGLSRRGMRHPGGPARGVPCQHAWPVEPQRVSRIGRT